MYSLILNRGTGSPTFTRATTATFTDFEGVLRTAISGEARFQGARRIWNRVGNSYDLTATGGWSVNANASISAIGVTDPEGGATAFTVTATGATGQWYKACGAIDVPHNAVIGNQYLNSIYIRRRTGTGTVNLITINNARTNITSSLTSSWQRLSDSVTAATGTNSYLGVELITSGDQVDVWHPQQEDVTGQSVQTAGEYVSVGVVQRNLLTYTSQVSNAAWAKTAAGTGSIPTVTDNYSDATYGAVERVQFSMGAGRTAGDYSILTWTGPATVSNPHTTINSVWLRSNDGNSHVLALGDGYVGVSNITVTTAWQQFTYQVTAAASATANITLRQMGNGDSFNTADILFYHPQLEYGTTPTTYQDVGGTYMYHGAGVDGVQYLPTLPNGLPISSSTAKYASLPGVAGSYFSTPDSAANRIGGDLDIDVCAVWPNGANVGNNRLCCKRAATVGMWDFYINSAGTLFLYIQGGTVSSSVTAPYYNKNKIWLRFTRRSSDGRVQFFTSSDGVIWSQLGTDQSSTAGTVTTQTELVTLGAFGNGTSDPMLGNIYSARIYSGIRESGGTLAVNFNANDYQTGTTWAASSTGETWTINGGASIFGAGASAPFDANGPKGYLSEGSRQNICLQSNAFTTTWTNTLGTLSQNATGPDGATSAWTATDNSAVSVLEFVQTGLTLTAAAWTFSIFVKKTSGATSYPVVFAYTATGTIRAPVTIDTNNGIATAWTAYTGNTIPGGFSATCRDYNSTFWRVEFTFTGTAASYQFDVCPAGTTNATQSTGAVDGTAQGTNVFYGAQVELGSFASTYIPTTTVAVTRNADVLTYPSSGNVLGTSGWCYAEIAGVNIPSGARFIDLGTNRPALYVSATTAWSIYDGVTEAQSPAFTASGSVQKGTSTWPSSTNKFRCAANGALGTEANFDGNMDVGTTISIGCTNAGASQSFGTIRNVRIGQVALSSGTLGNITQP